MAGGLSDRKLPEKGKDLAGYFRRRGFERAAKFFDPYASYSIVNPDGRTEGIVKKEIPADVLEEMFLSVKTKDGRKVYSSAKLVYVDPRELYRLQVFIFSFKLEAMGGDIHERYPGAFLLIDEANKEIAVYMPPIVEKHGSKLVLVDGTHRAYIALVNGKTFPAVVCEAKVPLPAKIVGKVSEISSDDILPYYVPTGGRDKLGRPKFYDLKPELFRMYNYAGFGKFDRSKKVMR